MCPCPPSRSNGPSLSYSLYNPGIENCPGQRGVLRYGICLTKTSFLIVLLYGIGSKVYLNNVMAEYV